MYPLDKRTSILIYPPFYFSWTALFHHARRCSWTRVFFNPKISYWHCCLIINVKVYLNHCILQLRKKYHKIIVKIEFMDASSPLMYPAKTNFHTNPNRIYPGFTSFIHCYCSTYNRKQRSRAFKPRSAKIQKSFPILATVISNNI